MNAYQQMKELHQKEFNAFPLGFALTDESFDKMMRDWGLEPTDTKKICKIPNTGFGFMRKSDVPAFLEMIERHRNEEKELMETVPDFAYDMFRYELANHEYGYTYDTDDTVEALGLTYDEIEADPKLKDAFERAKRDIIQQEDW